jgi:hypothetical protein
VLRLWRWAFARFYIQQRRAWGDSGDPAQGAAFLLGLVMFSNAFAGAVAVAAALGDVRALIAYKWHGAAAGLLLVFVVYRQYAADDRIKRLIAKMSRESWAKKRREERKLWGYVFASAALPFIVAAVAKLLRGQ